MDIRNLNKHTICCERGTVATSFPVCLTACLWGINGVLWTQQKTIIGSDLELSWLKSLKIKEKKGRMGSHTCYFQDSIYSRLELWKVSLYPKYDFLFLNLLHSCSFPQSLLHHFQDGCLKHFLHMVLCLCPTMIYKCLTDLSCSPQPHNITLMSTSAVTV